MFPEIYDPRQVSLPMEPATFLTLTPRRTAYPVLSEKLWNFSRLPGFIQMVTDFAFVNHLYTLCYKMLELLWLLVILFDVGRVFSVCLKRVRGIVKSDYRLCYVCPSVHPHGKTRLPLDGFL